MMRWPHLGRRTIAWAAVSLVLTMPVLVSRPESLWAAGAPLREDVRAEAVHGGYRLIDLGELRGRLEREPGRILLVDTRQDWEYRTGHMPNSVNFSFEPTLWARLKNRWALAKALGPDKSRPIVFY